LYVPLLLSSIPSRNSAKNNAVSFVAATEASSSDAVMSKVIKGIRTPTSPFPMPLVEVVCTGPGGRNESNIFSGIEVSSSELSGTFSSGGLLLIEILVSFVEIDCGNVEIVGFIVGSSVGSVIGLVEDVAVNLPEGPAETVAVRVGLGLSLSVGKAVGENEIVVEFDEGGTVGDSIGDLVGFRVGSRVGSRVGMLVGGLVGVFVGVYEGELVGDDVGLSVSFFANTVLSLRIHIRTK